MISETRKKVVFVGLSGGVDSAVSAFLLLQAGYDVRGVFMKNFSQEILVDGKLTECWVPEWHDALRVAAHLKIPLVRWDFEKEYRAEVYDYFQREYAAGRTPNPDVLCNVQIKFGVFYARARAEGADFIATGHYARTDGTGKLFCAADEEKDQTYFLNQVSREALTHTLFPLGDMKKTDVRALAREAGIAVAEKKDSTGVCFIGEVPLKDFLAKSVQSASGSIVTTAGKKIGEHDGLSWYTIGQRHGFGATGGGTPLYVVEKNFARNELVVGEENDPALFTREVHVEDVHWIDAPAAGAKLCARFRHRQPLQEISSWQLDGTSLILQMQEPQRAITPGQFAVLYCGEECMGGGVIIDKTDLQQ